MRQALRLGLGLAVVLLAGVVLAIGVFVAHGLHAQPASQIAGGYFDPKDLVPFNAGPVGQAAWLLAILSVGALAALGGPLALVLAVLLKRVRLAAVPRWTGWAIVGSTTLGWLALRLPALSPLGVWLAD